MLPALFNHLWQSTLFAAVVGLLTLALRHNRARVRHGVWIAASIKFLIPMSALVSLIAALPWHAAPPVDSASTSAVVVMDAISQPFTWSATESPVHRSVWSVDAILLSIWLCGVIGIGLSWYVRWRRISVVVRAGSAIELNLPVDAIVCEGFLEPGVFGIFRPVLVLPRGLFEHLTPPQLDAVIAHELCHLRYRDNVVAAMQMAVETAFWFHPLVWWLGKRMLEERERACDEEVLITHAQPMVYADAILRVCRLYVESSLPCVAGVTGADLKQRIEDIMANRTMSGLNRGRKLMLAGAAALGIAVTMLIGLVDVSPIHAQSEGNPTFDAASVRLHASPVDRTTMVAPTALPGGRFVSRFPLAILIGWAYRLPSNPSMVTGMPDWTKQQGAVYDVEGTGTMPPGLSVQAQDDRVRAMVQALLVDRFKLVIRRQAEEVPVYALIVAKGGPKLQRADINEQDCPEPAPSVTPLGPVTSATPMPDVCHTFTGGMGRGVHGRAVTISDLAAFVENWTDRPLVDKTGISGLYRFDQSGFLAMNMPPPDPNGPLADRPTVSQMFASFGLKMEPQKGVVDVWVIDHVEKASPDGAR